MQQLLAGVEVASRDEIIPTFRIPATPVRVWIGWWAAMDSNHLPRRYQHRALPVELAAPGEWQGRKDLNPRPSVLETDALTRLSYAPVASDRVYPLAS